GRFAGAPYAADLASDDAVTLTREDRIGDVSVRVSKSVRVESPSVVEAVYEVSRVGKPSTSKKAVRTSHRFGVSVNLGLLYRFEPAGTLLIDDASYALPEGGASSEAARVAVSLDGVPVAVAFDIDPPAAVDVRP